MAINFVSKVFKDYSKIDFTSNFDLIDDSIDMYSVGYKYEDECFGLNLKYNQYYFSSTPDSLSITMNFKFIGPVPDSIISNMIYEPLGLDTSGSFK